jgi:hypothetical protein
VLFLYRPPQTYMPYALPKHRTDQAAYNRELQAKYNATRRAAPPQLTESDPQQEVLTKLRQLGELHSSGTLTDDEFAAEKVKVLASGVDAT